MQICLVWIGWIRRAVWPQQSEAGECEKLDRSGKRDPVLNCFGRVSEMFLTSLLMAQLGCMSNSECSQGETDLCVELGIPTQRTVYSFNINFSG